MSPTKFDRRDFLTGSMRAGVGVGLLQASDCATSHISQSKESGFVNAVEHVTRAFGGVYDSPFTDQIAFPLGGMGAGMMCLEGSGALSKFSLRHRPELEGEHRVFAAISIAGAQPRARVLEGPVPQWKLRPQFRVQDMGNTWGLPRLHRATFETRFPFATVDMQDDDLPLQVSVTGWSPFSPGDADNSSLPVAGLEYRIHNRSESSVEGIFSFNAENLLANETVFYGAPAAERSDRILATTGGFVLHSPGEPEHSWDAADCAFFTDDIEARVSHSWPCDSLSLLWRQFERGNCELGVPLPDRAATGASIFVPVKLAAGQTKTVTVYVAWYVPNSNLFEPVKGFKDGKSTSYVVPTEKYRPWYAQRFSGISEIVTYWRDHYSVLWEQADLFARTLRDSTLPPEIMEAVSSNLAILKSTTVLRQHDGRLWGWEGSYLESPTVDRTGISGTTTHVWNYAQAIPHLFPALERGLRETEFGSNQNDEGLQYCRTPLPIRQVEPGHILPDGPAADGQLGGIIKVYREWRISGDKAWLHSIWPRVRASLDYCIRTWDPGQRGALEEPHFTTYDMEFWGTDSLCTSLYIGALQAAASMGDALNDPVSLYSELLIKAVKRMEAFLFNGEYFFQDTTWKHLRTPFSPYQSPWADMYGKSEDWQTLIQREGPSGQYETGCLSDGVMGMWLSLVSGMEPTLDVRKIKAHLLSVYRHNFKRDLTVSTNLLRAFFACNNESGLLLCTWPRGARPSMPIIYSDEVWTGVEYQVASHLLMLGYIDQGLDIVRAVRHRYDGRVRNPFDEVEAGHWYARAMSSYALLQACSGARFDAVDKVLYLRPTVKGDFRCFLSTGTGYGTVGVRDGKPFLEVVSGHIPYQRIEYTAA